MPLQVALLDVDGTLVDSNDAHAHSWVETLARFGFQVPFGRVRDLIGKGGDKLLPEVTGLEKDSPEGKRISEQRAALFKAKYLPRLRSQPGARALVEALKQRGLGVVVATSARDDELQALLRVARIADLVDQATTSGDAKESKPAPDIVAAALRRSGCPASDAVMLGDTPYDVQAATRAGVRVVALRCGGWDGADLAGAAAIYDDPADLLRHIDESPFSEPRTSRPRS